MKKFFSMSAVVASIACLAAPMSAWSDGIVRPAGIADRDDPLIVAGYRALFTCSAHFFAGRDLADIEKVELVDTLKAGFPSPIIDEARQLVRASTADGLTQVAAFRDTMGCTLLPPHWNEGDVARLPYVAYARARSTGPAEFPLGDRIDLPGSGIATSARALSDIVSQAFDAATFGDGTVTTGLIIIKDDRVLVERYRPGFGVNSGYRTWSTSKSITGAIIGIAIAEGLLDVDKPAPIPEWQHGADPRQKITLQHLLRMSSGLHTGGSNTNAIYFAGQDVISAATTTALEADPGTRWTYSNNDTLLLLRALRFRLDNDLRYLRYPYETLLHRIGMMHTRMEIDHRGNFIGSSQTYTTLRDLARFGLLLANDGVWGGERLLPKGWVEYLTTPAPAKATEAGDWGYGAQFWLLDNIAGVPTDTYTTAGNKGQYVTVVPSEDLVVVRTGVDPLETRWNLDKFLAAVLEEID